MLYVAVLFVVHVDVAVGKLHWCVPAPLNRVVGPAGPACFVAVLSFPYLSGSTLSTLSALQASGWSDCDGLHLLVVLHI